MKQLIEDIAKALVDIPEEVSVRGSAGRTGHGAGVESGPQRSGQSHRKAGPHRPFHPHDSGSGGHEAEPPLHAGNPGVSLSDADWVTVALLGKTRGNRGEITALPLSSKPERFESLREVYLFGTSARRTYEVESTWFHDGTLDLQIPRRRFHFRCRAAVGRGSAGSDRRARARSIRANSSNPTSIGCEVVDRADRRSRSGRSPSGRMAAARACWSSATC